MKYSKTFKNALSKNEETVENFTKQHGFSLNERRSLRE